jgi:hypothetical protein
LKQVYLVEDHHCVTAAQRLLAEKLLELGRQPITAVAVEGYLPDEFQVLDIKLCATLLREGKISGGEFAIQRLSSQGVQIVQLDAPEVYRRNHDALARLFRTLDKNIVAVQALRTVATGIDSSGFPANLERANLAFHFQSKGAPATFPAETWALLVHGLLNLAIDWNQWQIAERVLPQDLWRDTFVEHLPTDLGAEALFECIDAALTFNRLNQARDAVYADRMETALDRCDRLVFALGPFHHEHLAMLLRKRGIEVHRVAIPYEAHARDLKHYRQRIMET